MYQHGSDLAQVFNPLFSHWNALKQNYSSCLTPHRTYRLSTGPKHMRKLGLSDITAEDG